MVKVKLPIYIIGMPGCGKTTISQSMSHQLKLECVDFDKHIILDEKRSIKEIFDTQGESYFRLLETKKLELHRHFNGIISTGGGIVLNPYHQDMMREGHVIFIDTSYDILKSRLLFSEDRPKQLIDGLEKVYTSRYSLYKAFADVTIENNGSLEEVIKKIMHHLEA